MTRMKRLAAAALGLGLATSLAHSADLKFANCMAPTHSYVTVAFDPFAARLAEATGGAVMVKVFNGGELGAGPADQYARVVYGVAEFAFGLPGYTAASFPLTLLTELPGGITETDGTAAIRQNIDLFQPEFERVKLVGLWSNALSSSVVAALVADLAVPRHSGGGNGAVRGLASGLVGDDPARRTAP